MKPLLIVFGILVLTLTARADNSVIGRWLSTEASEVNGTLELTGESGPPLTASGSGITLEKDPQLGQVVAFDGTQEVTLQSIAKMESAPALKISTKVWINNGDTNGRIIGFSNMEIRYVAKTQQLSLIAWINTDGVIATPTVEIKAPLDEWVTVTAEAKGSTLKISAGDDSNEREIEGTYAGDPSLIFFGLGLERPFNGKLAEIEISSIAD